MTEMTNKEEQVSSTKFIHAHIYGGGRATVAWQQDPNQKDMISFGVAWCSPKDHFRRDRGRLIAEGRRVKRPCNCLVELTKREDREFVSEDSVLAAATVTGFHPRWAEGLTLFTWPRKYVAEKAQEVCCGEGP